MCQYEFCFGKTKWFSHFSGTRLAILRVQIGGLGVKIILKADDEDSAENGGNGDEAEIYAEYAGKMFRL